MLKRERVLSRFHTIGAPERPWATHPIRCERLGWTSLLQPRTGKQSRQPPGSDAGPEAELEWGFDILESVYPCWHAPCDIRSV